MAALKSILVPVDGSLPSLAALEHAVVLAEDDGASVDVLQVTTGRDEVGAEAMLSSLSPGVRRDAERALDDAIDRARARLDGRVSRRTMVGDPVRTIVEAARDGGFDLIVIGTHGRVGRLHSMLGSVAEGVVRNAPCPVLTVRDSTGGYQSFAERRHGRPSVADQTTHRR